MNNHDYLLILISVTSQFNSFQSEVVKPNQYLLIMTMWKKHQKLTLKTAKVHFIDINCTFYLPIENYSAVDDINFHYLNKWC